MIGAKLGSKESRGDVQRLSTGRGALLAFVFVPAVPTECMTTTGQAAIRNPEGISLMWRALDRGTRTPLVSGECF